MPHPTPPQIPSRPRRPNRARELAASLSHLAVTPALYTLGAAACTEQLAGLHRLITGRTAALAAGVVLCTACSAYLLDRVKLTDRWLDPADQEAHPLRFGFIARYSGRLRAASLAMLLSAAWLALALAPWGPALPAIAAVGVVLYAPRPKGRRPRPKDMILLKNAYAAVGIAAFAAIVALAASDPGADLPELLGVARAHAAGLAVSAAFVAVRVVADAALCDLDDEHADRRFGTGTLPIRLGRDRAWALAMWTRIGSSALLALIPAVPFAARLAWAGVTIVSSLGLRIASPSRVRDWVDLRFAAEAAAVGLLLVLVH